MELNEIKAIDDVKASELIGVAVQTLRNWRFEGKGPPYIKCGRAVRYRVKDLAEWMNKRRICP